MQPVPESRVEIAVQVDSLLRLPQGAAYVSHSGQARAQVMRRGDTVYITGTCDSLARQVEYYESLYHTARDALCSRQSETRTEKERRSNPIKTFLAGLLAGALAGTTVTVITTKKLKRQ